MAVPQPPAALRRNLSRVDALSVLYIRSTMAKHLVDIDETALAAAQAELGTASMKDTVNEALRRAGAQRSTKVQNALDRLAQRRISPREEAWR
jgi:Arc/MetJ family transcription regulator